MAWTTAAGVEGAAPAVRARGAGAEELPQAASANIRRMARPTAANRPCRRLLLVKRVPFLSFLGVRALRAAWL